MKTLFLILAIVGAVVPYLFFAGFMADRGMALDGFVSALFSNGASGGFTADLLAGFLALYVQPFRRTAAAALRAAESDHRSVLCVTGIHLRQLWECENQAVAEYGLSFHRSEFSLPQRSC